VHLEIDTLVLCTNRAECLLITISINNWHVMFVCCYDVWIVRYPSFSIPLSFSPYLSVWPSPSLCPFLSLHLYLPPLHPFTLPPSLPPSLPLSLSVSPFYRLSLPSPFSTSPSLPLPLSGSIKIARPVFANNCYQILWQHINHEMLCLWNWMVCMVFWMLLVTTSIICH